ncbi:PIG-L family deacetylase [Rhizobium sp. P32RR-XVIII]|uniref:PIG-L deacetylase family protein n=1 Tax=Rhizobium sp. P32RR-XVIII TaxID=2726738 RepID=UPI0014572A67|nr:PIG-L deacetylase family protein [Rhizobium sp. P32RR-XVIII]NLS07809.1 PIG-L family deacetylase [Rhizobium sp. P32RR-XVIII]
MLSELFGRTLVIAPHADDEVLGAGGTVARLASEGSDVRIAIVTEGKPPHFPSEGVARVKEEARRAHEILGAAKTYWMGFPAAGLAETVVADLNASLLELVAESAPQTLLIPFVGDIHVDHQIVFTASLVAARPHQTQFPKLILAYETLSETNWNAAYVTPNFAPNVFVDIEDHLETKLKAMAAFESQIRPVPHERAIETLKALATLRGATVFRRAAEAFVLVRQVL